MAFHDDVDDANDANDKTSSEHEFELPFPKSAVSKNDGSDSAADATDDGLVDLSEASTDNVLDLDAALAGDEPESVSTTENLDAPSGGAFPASSNARMSQMRLIKGYLRGRWLRRRTPIKRCHNSMPLRFRRRPLRRRPQKGMRVTRTIRTKSLPTTRRPISSLRAFHVDVLRKRLKKRTPLPLLQNLPSAKTSQKHPPLLSLSDRVMRLIRVRATVTVVQTSSASTPSSLLNDLPDRQFPHPPHPRMISTTRCGQMLHR